MMDLAQLSLAELTAHLAEVTAELQRRAMSPTEKKRQQTAERTRRWRERQAQNGAARDAVGDAPCDASVTHSTGKDASPRDASVTQGDAVRDASRPSPSPQVSPTPPSSPAPTPTLSPARIREDADIVAIARQTFPNHPEIATEIPAWTEHCREHAEKRGKSFTKYTARTQLMELARMGPDKALLALRTSAAKGSASIIDPDEQRFGGVNGHGHANGTRPRAPDRDTTPLAVDPALFRAFLAAHPDYRTYNRTPATEADLLPSMIPDWKIYKARHRKTT